MECETVEFEEKKTKGNYDVRSRTVHDDAVNHSEHRIYRIQVQIQWHSPATMATTLRANRLTSDARFNLFDGEIPVHTTHKQCGPSAHCSRTHIRRNEQATDNEHQQQQQQNGTEGCWLQRSHVDLQKLLFIHLNCR